MKQGKGNYFFAPRIGEKYHEGFNGIRTLVVGAYHICYENCPFKDLCCDVDTVKEMDYKCPKYKDAPFYEKAEDQLCLHNSNIIEINSYCEDEARYPAYSVFTHDMTKLQDGITSQQKYDFWESIAFTNFFQCYCPSDLFPEEIDIEKTNKNATKAFLEILEELKPQLIYVWTKHIGEVIDKNLQKFPGLKKENFPNNNPSLRIYLYSYNYSINNVELKDIDNYLQIKFPQKQIIPSAYGRKKKVASLSQVLFNAVKRGYLQFDNGELVISSNILGKEIGYIIHQIKQLYDFNDWKQLDEIISKYKQDGTKVKTLRTMHKYNNTEENQGKIAELDKDIFATN
jgi:hypothetical protein